MPLSSLNDPTDIARAQGALEQAWQQVGSAYADPKIAESQRKRLAYIVASFALIAADEHDLVKRSVQRFRETA